MPGKTGTFRLETTTGTQVALVTAESTYRKTASNRPGSRNARRCRPAIGCPRLQ